LRKYVLDTHLYVDAVQDADKAGELEAFYAAFLPVTYLSSVVVMELRAGALDRRTELELDRALIAPFERRRRVLTPSHQAWRASGELLADLARRDGLDLRRTPKSFVNDILLALSCREAGMTLITGNVRDFKRIRRSVRFEFVRAWPEPE
jgi:predicted nucleic acid-binding protein